MRRISFSSRNRSNNILYIEVPGAIVNIRVNLFGADGRRVTYVEVIPDQGWESADGGRNLQVVETHQPREN
jgi:hypothetical protein